MKKTSSAFCLAAVAFAAAMGTIGCAADTGDEEDLIAGEEMENAGEVEEVGEAQDTIVVSNASFEAGPWVVDYLTLGAGSTLLTGWLVGGYGIDYIGAHWTSFDGVRSIDLNSTGPGSISRTFPTVVGKTYTVTFRMAGNPHGAQGVKTLRLYTSPTAYSVHTFSTTGKTPSAMGWTAKSATFTATSTSTTLTWQSMTDGMFGPALDGPITITP